jgi:transposase
MDRILEWVAGLDVHKKTVTACVRVPGPHGMRRPEVRTFGTTVPELLTLREWLVTHGVTHVAMESTGVYWKPVFYVLEEVVTCVLANAAHIVQVPGRKTDMLVTVILDNLAEGLGRDAILQSYPTLEPAHIDAALAYAAELAREESLLPLRPA